MIWICRSVEDAYGVQAWATQHITLNISNICSLCQNLFHSKIRAPYINRPPVYV